MNVVYAIVKWIVALFLGWVGAIAAAHVLAVVAVAKYGIVALPAVDVTAVNGIVVALVSIAITYLITIVPWFQFLVAYEQQIGLAIAGALVLAFNQAVPDVFGQSAILLVEFVIALFAAFGFIHKVKKEGVHTLIGGVSK